MTKTFCDKCGDEVKKENVYNLTLRDFTAELCVNCAAEVQTVIEAG